MAGGDDYEIPESGAVFTFGRSRFADNLSSHFFIRNDPVLEISCGDEHTALVCKSGRIFLFGNNDYGQLGFGHTKVVNKPSCLKYLKPFHSTHVACGKGHTIVSTACGRIFTFGCNSDGQLGLGDLNDRLVPQMLNIGLPEEVTIAAVAAGCHHSALLTDKYELYLWGSNSDGQCGVEGVSYIGVPQKFEFEEPISYISCGYYHTAFISNGQVYTFGEEDNGKLGRSRQSSKTMPEKVEMPELCSLVKCGGSHTMVLTEGGSVYAFGSNFSGQLGIGIIEAECPTPTKINFPDQSGKIVYLSCGESHSGFVTEKGELYTCGDARHGKLCNDDDSTNFTTPTPIPAFENYFCNSVSCGGCHTMVLAKVRIAENDTELILPQSKEILPPLKPKVDNIELTNATDDAKINNEEKQETEQKANVDEIEECDSKSNTESNINNEEAISHLDEIYTEIEDIVTVRNEDEPKSETKSVRRANETNENDVVVVRTESVIKKVFNVFKKKKSVSAILLKNKSADGKDITVTDNNQSIGNQDKSRTCTIL